MSLNDDLDDFLHNVEEVTAFGMQKLIYEQGLVLLSAAASSREAPQIVRLTLESGLCFHALLEDKPLKELQRIYRRAREITRDFDVALDGGSESEGGGDGS